MKQLLFFLMLGSAIPRPLLGQFELKNLSLRKSYSGITYDVSWKVDIVNRGARPVRLWLEFTFIDKEGFAVAQDNGRITVAAGDSVTYREVRAFTPAHYEAIVSVEAKAEQRSYLRRPSIIESPRSAANIYGLSRGIRPIPPSNRNGIRSE